MNTTHQPLLQRRNSWLTRFDGNPSDSMFKLVVGLFSGLVLFLLIAIAIQMVRASEESLAEFGLGFILSSEWDPVRGQFGALPFIFGTIVSSLLALALAVPVALGAAVFLSELAPAWLRGPVGFMIELLAAVPSVVYGLWGIFALAPFLRESVQPGLGEVLGFLPFFQGPPLGYGMMAGGVILAIMILPTIASVSREVLLAVPNPLREGAWALGATKSEAIFRTVLPAARSGLVGAVILGLGRALGETMAITMVIGNRPEISASLFAPSYTMASVIANEFTEATEDLYLAALAEIGLLLFVVTLILNVIARLLVLGVSRKVAS